MELADGDIIIFKSVFTDEYVRVTDDGCHLSANEKESKNPMARFTLEKARDGMWRIKSLATNKYWQVKSGSPSRFVTPDGDADSEDTLFRIERFGCGQTTTIRFIHHHLNRYVCVHNTNDTDPFYLWAISANTDKASKDVFVHSPF